jgi:hypothetical protein
MLGARGADKPPQSRQGVGHEKGSERAAFSLLHQVLVLEQAPVAALQGVQGLATSLTGAVVVASVATGFGALSPSAVVPEAGALAVGAL